MWKQCGKKWNPWIRVTMDEVVGMDGGTTARAEGSKGLDKGKGLKGSTRAEIGRKGCIYVLVLRLGIYTTLTGGSECIHYKEQG
jgi:hypothetical protein